jgi:hypothetical protein
MLNKVRNTNSSGSGNNGCIKLTSQYNLGVNSFVGYGPTTNTGFWQSIDPGTGGYCIYQFKGANYGDQGPSIYKAANDAELISFTQHITGSALTPNQCISYYNQQNDKFVTNINYPDIVTSGAVAVLDAGFVKSAWQTGTTVFTDLSFGGNNFTLTNWDYVQSGTSREGSYFNLVSGNSANSEATTFPALTSFTMNVFFKQNGLQSGRVCLIDGSTNFYLALSGNSVFGGFRNTSAVYQEVFDNSYTTNQWYCSTITYDGVSGELRIYKNGALTSLLNAAGSPIQNTSGIVHLGDCGGSGIFNGWIPVVQIYNRALNSSEVLQNYNAYYTRYSLPANAFQFLYQVRTPYSLSGDQTIDNFPGSFSVTLTNPQNTTLIDATSAVTIGDVINISATAASTGIQRGVKMTGLETIGGSTTEVSVGYAFNGSSGIANPPFGLNQSGATYQVFVTRYEDLNYYVNLTTAGSGNASISFSGQVTTPVYSSPTSASGDYNNIQGPILNFGDTVTVGVGAGSAPTLLTIEKQSLGTGAITSIYSANTSSVQSTNFTYDQGFSYSISITS